MVIRSHVLRRSSCKIVYDRDLMGLILKSHCICKECIAVCVARLKNARCCDQITLLLLLLMYQST
jgi:hypothetical protein